MWILTIKQGLSNSVEFKFNELYVAVEFISGAAETASMPAEFVLKWEEGVK